MACTGDTVEHVERTTASMMAEAVREASKSVSWFYTYYAIAAGVCICIYTRVNVYIRRYNDSHYTYAEGLSDPIQYVTA